MATISIDTGNASPVELAAAAAAARAWADVIDTFGNSDDAFPETVVPETAPVAKAEPAPEPAPEEPKKPVRRRRKAAAKPKVDEPAPEPAPEPEETEAETEPADGPTAEEVSDLLRAALADGTLTRPDLKELLTRFGHEGPISKMQASLRPKVIEEVAKLKGADDDPLAGL